MSPYVEVMTPDTDAEPDTGGEAGVPQPDEALVRCTECEYAAPRSEFVPENYR
jgi:hypothetical protein